MIVERIIHSLFQACIDPDEYKQITGKKITWDYINHLEALAENTLSEVTNKLTKSIAKHVYKDIHTLSDSEKCARFLIKVPKIIEEDTQHSILSMNVASTI